MKDEIEKQKRQQREQGIQQFYFKLDELPPAKARELEKYVNDCV